MLVPGLVGGVEEVDQGAAVLIDAHAHVVHEVEGVVRELRLGLQQVGQEAEGEVCDGGQDVGEQGQGVGRGPRQALGLHEGPEPQEDGQRRQQVGPDVDHLVVFLKEAKKVVAPLAAGGAVPGADVRLPEELGHVALGHGAGHLGQPILQELGQASQVLPAHGQGAQTLQDGGRHGCPGMLPAGNSEDGQRCRERGAGFLV